MPSDSVFASWINLNEQGWINFGERYRRVGIESGNPYYAVKIPYFTGHSSLIAHCPILPLLTRLVSVLVSVGLILQMSKTSDFQKPNAYSGR